MDKENVTAGNTQTEGEFHSKMPAEEQMPEGENEEEQPYE